MYLTEISPLVPHKFGSDTLRLCPVHYAWNSLVTHRLNGYFIFTILTHSAILTHDVAGCCRGWSCRCSGAAEASCTRSPHPALIRLKQGNKHENIDNSGSDCNPVPGPSGDSQTSYNFSKHHSLFEHDLHDVMSIYLLNT